MTFPYPAPWTSSGPESAGRNNPSTCLSPQLFVQVDTRANDCSQVVPSARLGMWPRGREGEGGGAEAESARQREISHTKPGCKPHGVSFFSCQTCSRAGCEMNRPRNGRASLYDNSGMMSGSDLSFVTDLKCARNCTDGGRPGGRERDGKKQRPAETSTPARDAWWPGYFGS